ncbi:MAG TPA: cytochrome P450 [Mycobacteriales bacterium]|nr:cytochrome P450 [Mycobacteriales bacterium]
MTDTETEAALVGFNPFAPGFTDNPYPHYAELRRANPVERHELGFWALWRYADVFEVLRARLSVDDANVTNQGPMASVYDQVYAEKGIPADRVQSMLDRDPPDHTRLRKLVSQAFTPKTIQQLEPTVVQLVDEALDAIGEAGECNLIDALAFPLPFTVISVMLGMPETDSSRLRELSHQVVKSLEPVPDEATVRAIVEADMELVELTSDAIAWKRKNPADDLLTALINAEDAGDVLSDQELVAQVLLLYIAGHETTVNLIGNGTLALLRQRDQLELWRDRPDLDDNAVEELLRFDPPVQMSRRVTLDDYAVGGHVIPAGTFVIASLASANRDEEQFGEDADRLRLDRDNARQQASFGAGVHHCLGAALARLEGRVAISRLIRRFPALELADEPEWNGRINLRGCVRLPVSVG